MIYEAECWEENGDNPSTCGELVAEMDRYIAEGHGDALVVFDNGCGFLFVPSKETRKYDFGVFFETEMVEEGATDEEAAETIKACGLPLKEFREVMAAFDEDVVPTYEAGSYDLAEPLALGCFADIDNWYGDDQYYYVIHLG